MSNLNRFLQSPQDLAKELDELEASGEIFAPRTESAADSVPPLDQSTQLLQLGGPADCPPYVHDLASIKFMQADLAKSGLQAGTDFNAYPVASDPFTKLCSYVMWSDVPRLNHGPLGTHITNWKLKLEQPPRPVGLVGAFKKQWDDDHPKYKGRSKRAGGGPIELWEVKGTTAADRAKPVLLIVEGFKKAQKAKKQWPELDVVAADSVWGLLEKREDGSYELNESTKARIANKSHVEVVFDGDVEGNGNVEFAANVTAGLLVDAGKQVEIKRPSSLNKLDDLLVDHPHLLYANALVAVDTLMLRGPQSRPLYKRLGCTFAGKNLQLVGDAANASRLIAALFEERVIYDQNFGYMLDGAPIELDRLMQQCWYILQTYHKPGWNRKEIAAGFFNVKFRETSTIKDQTHPDIWDGVHRLYDEHGKPLVEASCAERLKLTARSVGVQSGATHFAHTPNPTTVVADEAFRITLTGMAFRIETPGCIFDNVLTLKADQGSFKTKFYESLATFTHAVSGETKKFYSDIDEIPTLASHSARTTFGIMIRNAIILNLAENQARNNKTKTGNNAYKTFVTKTQFEYRTPYADINTVALPGYIITADSNLHLDLTDPSGARRDIILELEGPIAIPDQALKLQYLAEARAKRKLIQAYDWWEVRGDQTDLPEGKAEGMREGMKVQDIISTAQERRSLPQEIILNALHGGLPIVQVTNPETKLKCLGFVISLEHYCKLAASAEGVQTFPARSAITALGNLAANKRMTFQVLPLERFSFGQTTFLRGGLDINGSYAQYALNINISQYRGYAVIPRKEAGLVLDGKPVISPERYNEYCGNNNGGTSLFEAWLAEYTGGQ